MIDFLNKRSRADMTPLPPVRTSLSDLEGHKVTLPPTDGLQIVRLYLEQRAAMSESERAVILDVIRWLSMPVQPGSSGTVHVALGCDQCRCEGVIECTCVCHVPDEQPGS